MAKEEEKGWRISDHEILGRAMITTRSFSFGEEILSESPFITYLNFSDAINKFLHMDAEKKQKFLDFYHLESLNDDKIEPKCRKFFSSHWEDAKRLAEAYGELSPVEIFKIMTVCSFNAHTFFGNINIETETKNRADGSCSALFLFGSKVTHSCRPNCIYSSNRTIGHGDYITIQTLDSDQIITFDYGINSSTEKRREKLIMEKNFFCMCEKCIGLDYTRGMNCKKCLKESYSNAVKLCIQPDKNTPVQWSCQKCGDTTAPTTSDLNYEKDLNSWLVNYQKKMQQGYPLPDGIRELELKLRDVGKIFYFTHYLNFEIYSQLSLMDASAVAFFQRVGERIELINRHRERSVSNGCIAVQISECQEAECVHGLDCKTEHPPSRFCTHQILWSCEDAKQLNVENSLVTRCARLVLKYKRLLLSQFGEKDFDVISALHLVDVAGLEPVLTRCGFPACFNPSCEKGKLLFCSRCKGIAYCSKEAQKEHWKTHKKICKTK